MQEADHLLIPLLDGTFGLAQVARVNDARALIHITVTRATPDTTAERIDAAHVVATVRVERSGLTADQWPVIGYTARPQGLTTQPGHLTGKDAIDPAIVEAFASALHGLYPWDGFPDPTFFDQLLRSPNHRPKGVRLRADFPHPDKAPS